LNDIKTIDKYLPTIPKLTNVKRAFKYNFKLLERIKIIFDITERLDAEIQLLYANSYIDKFILNTINADIKKIYSKLSEYIPHYDNINFNIADIEHWEIYEKYQLVTNIMHTRLSYEEFKIVTINNRLAIIGKIFKYGDYIYVEFLIHKKFYKYNFKLLEKIKCIFDIVKRLDNKLQLLFI